MGAKVIILANPYTYNFLKGLTHSAMVRLKLNVCPLVASAWQKAMHWEAKSESSVFIAEAAIFSEYLN